MCVCVGKRERERGQIETDTGRQTEKQRETEAETDGQTGRQMGREGGGGGGITVLTALGVLQGSHQIAGL